MRQDATHLAHYPEGWETPLDYRRPLALTPYYCPSLLHKSMRSDNSNNSNNSNSSHIRSSNRRNSNNSDNSPCTHST